MASTHNGVEVDCTMHWTSAVGNIISMIIGMSTSTSIRIGTCPCARPQFGGQLPEGGAGRSSRLGCVGRRRLAAGASLLPLHLRFAQANCVTTRASSSAGDTEEHGWLLTGLVPKLWVTSRFKIASCHQYHAKP